MVDSPLSAGLALLAGILSAFSPCILPVLPIVMGRSLQSHRYAPLVLVIGLVSGFALTGSLLGLASSWVTGLANVLRGVAIAFLLAMGLLAVFPQRLSQGIYPLRYRLSRFLPQPRLSQPKVSFNLGREFLLGTQLGILWTPCAGPVLGSILVLAAVNHQVAGAFWLLLFYGMGAAVPMLAIAYAGRYVSQSFQRLRPHTQKIQKVGGVMVILMAIAILQGWDIKLQLWLAPLFPPLFL
jgi:cytochrome c-type biogenesis protein